MNTMAEICEKRALSLLSTVLLVFFLVALVCAPCVAQQPSPAKDIPEDAAVKATLAGIIAVLIAFALSRGCGSKAQSNKGKSWRTAGESFVVEFGIIAILKESARRCIRKSK